MPGPRAGCQPRAGAARSGRRRRSQDARRRSRRGPGREPGHAGAAAQPRARRRGRDPRRGDHPECRRPRRAMLAAVLAVVLERTRTPARARPCARTAPRSGPSSAPRRSARPRARGSRAGRGPPTPVGVERHRRRVVAEEPVDAVADDLGQRADAAREDRRPARERLDADEPERLRPGARHEGRVALGEELIAIGGAELAEVLDQASRRASAPAGRRPRSSALVAREVADLRRDPQRPARPHRDVDRLDDALLGVDPADEAERLAGSLAEWRAVQAQAVVDDRPRARRGGCAPGGG